MCLLAVLFLAARHGLAADQSVFDWHLPKGFRAPPVPPDNSMSEAKVQLGRRLFHDQRMAVNGKGSCSTCHLQRDGFTDRKVIAEGVTGEKHPRRVMPLANVAWFAVFSWANPNMKDLEQQARTPSFRVTPRL